MFEVYIDPEFHGPTILELEPILDDITEVSIRVKWLNTRQEYVLLERHADRNFVLYVNDLSMMERVSTQLGIPFKVDPNLVATAKDALMSKKLYNWRQFTNDVGAGVSRNLVMKVAADAIRKGKQPKLAYVAKDVFLDSINPCDADVLVRLRILRGY